VSCLVLMLGLPLETWVRFFVWLIAGLGVYYFFGRIHSELRAEAMAASPGLPTRPAPES